MRTADVKVDNHYVYKGEIVRVLKRIQGRETKKRNMQSGELFTGYKRTQKKFLLETGEEVYAQMLTPLDSAEKRVGLIRAITKKYFTKDII